MARNDTGSHIPGATMTGPTTTTDDVSHLPQNINPSSPAMGGIGIGGGH